MVLLAYYQQNGFCEFYICSLREWIVILRHCAFCLPLLRKRFMVNNQCWGYQKSLCCRRLSPVKSYINFKWGFLLKLLMQEIFQFQMCQMRFYSMDSKVLETTGGSWLDALKSKLLDTPVYLLSRFRQGDLPASILNNTFL